MKWKEFFDLFEPEDVTIRRLKKKIEIKKLEAELKKLEKKEEE